MNIHEGKQTFYVKNAYQKIFTLIFFYLKIKPELGKV